jgi:hypothetical protein
MDQTTYLTEAILQLTEEIKSLRRELRPELARTAAIASRTKRVEEISLAAQKFTSCELLSPTANETDHEQRFTRN